MNVLKHLYLNGFKQVEENIAFRVYEKMTVVGGNQIKEQWVLNHNNQLIRKLKLKGDLLNGEPAWIEYYPENGRIKSMHYFFNDKLHNLTGPASVGYYEDGKIRYEEWSVNNLRHRENNPAIIIYYRNGNIMKSIWYKNGVLTRIDGPAMEYFDESGNKYKEIYVIDDKPVKEIHYIYGVKLELNYYYDTEGEKEVIIDNSFTDKVVNIINNI